MQPTGLSSGSSVGLGHTLVLHQVCPFPFVVKASSLLRPAKASVITCAKTLPRSLMFNWCDTWSFLLMPFGFIVMVFEASSGLYMTEITTSPKWCLRENTCLWPETCSRKRKKQPLRQMYLRHTLQLICGLKIRLFDQGGRRYRTEHALVTALHLGHYNNSAFWCCFRTFAQNCRNIEHLNLNGCTKITDR